MQPDLIGLEISKGELRRLTGFDPEDVFRPSVLRDSKKRLGFLINEMLVTLALTPIIVGAGDAGANANHCWLYLRVHYFANNWFVNSIRNSFTYFSANPDISWAIAVATIDLSRRTDNTFR